MENCRCEGHGRVAVFVKDAGVPEVARNNPAAVVRVAIADVIVRSAVVHGGNVATTAVPALKSTMVSPGIRWVSTALGRCMRR